MKLGEAWVEDAARLLLLGTVHFRKDADILREPRQREIAEVVEVVRELRRALRHGG